MKWITVNVDDSRHCSEGRGSQSVSCYRAMEVTGGAAGDFTRRGRTGPPSKPGYRFPKHKVEWQILELIHHYQDGMGEFECMCVRDGSQDSEFRSDEWPPGKSNGHSAWCFILLRPSTTLKRVYLLSVVSHIVIPVCRRANAKWKCERQTAARELG